MYLDLSAGHGLSCPSSSSSYVFNCNLYRSVAKIQKDELVTLKKKQPPEVMERMPICFRPQPCIPNLAGLGGRGVL